MSQRISNLFREFVIFLAFHNKEDIWHQWNFVDRDHIQGTQFVEQFFFLSRHPRLVWGYNISNFEKHTFCAWTEESQALYNAKNAGRKSSRSSPTVLPSKHKMCRILFIWWSARWRFHLIILDLMPFYSFRHFDLDIILDRYLTRNYNNYTMKHKWSSIKGLFEFIGSGSDSPFSEIIMAATLLQSTAGWFSRIYSWYMYL